MPKRIYQATVTAAYMGVVEASADNEAEALAIIQKGVRDGSIYVELSFSGITGVDTPEEVEDDEDE